MSLRLFAASVISFLILGIVLNLLLTRDFASSATQIDDFPRGQAFGPTPNITDRKDQSLVPVGPPLCFGNDEWFDARNRNLQTGLYGVCRSGYPSVNQLFIVDLTFIGEVVHFAAYGPPECAAGLYKPYNSSTCLNIQDFLQ